MHSAGGVIQTVLSFNGATTFISNSTYYCKLWLVSMESTISLIIVVGEKQCI